MSCICCLTNDMLNIMINQTYITHITTNLISNSTLLDSISINILFKFRSINEIVDITKVFFIIIFQFIRTGKICEIVFQLATTIRSQLISVVKTAAVSPYIGMKNIFSTIFIRTAMSKIFIFTFTFPNQDNNIKLSVFRLESHKNHQAILTKFHEGRNLSLNKLTTNSSQNTIKYHPSIHQITISA